MTIQTGPEPHSEVSVTANLEVFYTNCFVPDSIFLKPAIEKYSRTLLSYLVVDGIFTDF